MDFQGLGTPESPDNTTPFRNLTPNVCDDYRVSGPEISQDL